MKKPMIIAAALMLCVAAAAQAPGNRQGNIPGMGPNFVQTPDPVYVAYSVRASGSTLPDGRSRNNSPTFFIYPDARLDEAGAKALVESFGMDAVLKEHHGPFSNFNSLWADATQKRGAVEMPSAR